MNVDGSGGFQGALALVELMLEIYDSLVCTHDHRRTRDPDLCDEASNLAEADETEATTPSTQPVMSNTIRQQQTSLPQ